METTLSKRDLIIIIKDSKPHGDASKNIMHLGRWDGDLWVWFDHALDELNEKDLLGLYNYISNSWKGAHK